MPLYTLTKGSISGLIVNGESIDVKKGDTVDLPPEKAKEYRYLKLKSPSGDSQQANLDATAAAALAQTPTLKVADEEDNEVEEEGEELLAEEEVGDLSYTQNMKAVDVIEIVKETNSLSDLKNLQQLEENGQNRVGVLSAIEKRMRQLGED